MEKRNQATVTVVIATFNSEKILISVLEAIRKQTYSQNLIEIICVDGGSTDKTIEVATKYGCKVINNPKTEPVHAKLLGVQNASGKYLIYVDHDEVFENVDSIRTRVEALEKYPDCKVAFCSGYKRPPKYPMINQYISDFGDPFSCFMYKSPKDWLFFIPFLKRNCELIKKEETYDIYSFAKLKNNILIELCCLGTMINLEYFKETTDILYNETELVQLFYIMLEQKKFHVIVSKNDPIFHYSVDSLKAYLPKLKWRICNNVHFPDKSDKGFNGRIRYQKGLRYKKYLFVLYTVFFPASLIHSIYFAITRKNIVYLLHFILCFYVLFEIIIETVKKLLGIVPQFKSYDGKKKIQR